MTSSRSAFDDLVRRVRSGDHVAAEQLVRQFEPAIRREARLRLGPSIRHLADSVDICQAVLGTFFFRAAAGQFDLPTPNHLLRLLGLIARRKVAALARKPARTRSLDSDPVHPQADPAAIVANAELLEAFMARLTAEERRLWEMRRDGWTWEQISATLGVNADALRKRHRRMVHRIAQEIGMEE